MQPNELRTKDCSRQWLLYRLKKQYAHCLNFYQPTQRNESLVVASKSATILRSDNSFNISSFSSSESESSVDSIAMDISTVSSGFNQKYELFHAAMALRKPIEAKSDTNVMEWPPTANDLSLDNCISSVPSSLYNFLAVVTGATDDMSSLEEYSDINMTKGRKILSIAQDIMYLQSNGSRQTPKSVALGLTLRHMTGSKHISQMLNGLGHAASYDSVVRMETALALKQMNRASGIPFGFRKNSFTTLVYDNIDFSEETLSGSGTTHHTNGIMVQLNTTVEDDSPNNQVRLSRSQRTFHTVDMEMEPYFLTKKIGPQELTQPNEDTQQRCVNMYRKSHCTDMLYIMLKATMGADLLPGWTPFNISISSALPLSRIHYLPVIEASPTQLSTVKHILDSANAMAQQLECDSVMVVLDQAIYSKAQQIRWTSPALQQTVVLRMGEFHTTMCFLSAIGKRFQLSGLEDILIEAEVVAPGSINGVLSGHMYNRSVRAHKLLFEALSRLQFTQYLETLDDRAGSDVMARLLAMRESHKLSQTIDISSVDDIASQFTQYVEDQSRINPTFAYWKSYQDMVCLLLGFIRATRTADWNLHLATLRLMLPWMFAYDRTHYARYAPAYWLEMQNLGETHPWLHQQLISNSGCWTVQRQEKCGFSSLAPDQTIEVTINRESKTTGGIKGITMSRGAVQRWILAQPGKAEISVTCENMAGLEKGGYRLHKEGDRTRSLKDEASIQLLQEVVQSMINPWSNQYDQLISVSSGATASDEVAQDMSQAYDVGERKVQEFIAKRLVDKTEDVFSNIKASKLKTFAGSKLMKRTGLKEVKADRSMFAQLLIVAKQRQIDLKSILSYPLSSVPAPLSSADGLSLSKTNKAVLLHKLEEDTCPSIDNETTHALHGSVVVTDAMAMIQAIPTSQLPKTFGSFANLLLDKILTLAKRFNATRLDFVGDQYKISSIKNVERERRADTQVQEIAIYSGDQKLPKQWKKFLGSGKNKENLQYFICKHWQKSTCQLEIDVYVSVTKECVRLSWRTCNEVPVITVIDGLHSDHEEADTRMVLHAAHADHTGVPVVVICSPDTDVAVIALAESNNLNCQLLFATGRGNAQRVIDLTAMGRKLGSQLSQAIIGLHAFTGCDTTSSFYGKGKRLCYTLLNKFPEFVDMFAQFGHSYTCDSKLASMLEQFVCKLYGSDSLTVNDARHELFCTNTPLEKSLPPNNDALNQHIKRACYQTRVWRLATSNKMNLPSPSHHGWTAFGNKLTVTWLEGPPAPPEVLKLTSCHCRKGTCLGRCSCFSAQLKCTSLCSCDEKCQNNDINEDEDELLGDGMDTDEEI